MIALMRAVLLVPAVLLSISLGMAGSAIAHPHVFVTAHGTLIYGPGGALKEIRYAWTFDEMFSSFAIQGLDANGDGKFSREELAALAKENVDSLKEFGYFTVAPRGAKALEFGEPVDYFFDGTDTNSLTLHFTLPVKNAAKGGVAFEVYDPTYFVAFSLAEQKPVSLEDAPGGCAVEAKSASDPNSTKLSEEFFTQLQAGADYGAQFANRIAVRCP